jgi:hypothetical protein
MERGACNSSSCIHTRGQSKRAVVHGPGHYWLLVFLKRGAVALRPDSYWLLLFVQFKTDTVVAQHT